MAANAIQEIEDIHSRTFGRGARTIGVTGPAPKSGASTVAKSLATRCALSGKTTLLMDMSRGPDDVRDGDDNTGWHPGEAGMGQKIHKAKSGYDVLPVTPGGNTKFLFRDAKHLQQMLAEDLNRYDQVVVDLSPVPDEGRSSVPASIGAAACDAVILVCRTYAVTQAAVEDAVKNLADNEAKIAGLVMNDQNAPTIAEELLREMNRIRWFLPKGVRDFVEKKVRDVEILNKKL
ncbi:MAG: hypothetical protein AAFW47_08060 [Pseudomonadota bacterium]